MRCRKIRRPLIGTPDALAKFEVASTGKPTQSTGNNANNACYDRDALRGGDLVCAAQQMELTTWNVEGLTEINLEQIMDIMLDRGTAVMCLQETQNIRNGLGVLSHIVWRGH